MAMLEVKVPQLSESVSEATLLHWHRKVGEAVQLDENLVDIETDKVVLELPAPAAGVISKIYKEDGETVASGEIIALIDTKLSSPKPEKKSALAKEKKTEARPVLKDKGLSPRVMPAAARMMAESDLDVSIIGATGKDGRITKQDVIAAVDEMDMHELRSRERPSAPKTTMETQAQFAPGTTERAENRVPMSRLRARIAERLVQSQLTNATLSTFNEVNMQPVIDLRRKYSEQFEKEHGVRLGFMSFFMKAAVAALKKFPIVNASIDEDDIVYHGYYDIGIAISSPRGLVVPIMRDVDLMSIADIEKKIAEFNVQARDGRLSMDDLTGGTFSISNGGVFGSMLSTPIINPPQSAILGIHATKDRPVVENGEIVIRPMNYLALSYDHRLIDGREAVLALVTIKETLEDPARLLLDL